MIPITQRVCRALGMGFYYDATPSRLGRDSSWLKPKVGAIARNPTVTIMPESIW